MGEPGHLLMPFRSRSTVHTGLLSIRLARRAQSVLAVFPACSLSRATTPSAASSTAIAAMIMAIASYRSWTETCVGSLLNVALATLTTRTIAGRKTRFHTVSLLELQLTLEDGALSVD